MTTDCPARDPGEVAARLVTVDNGGLRLEGDLTFGGIAQLARQPLPPLAHDGAEARLDLSGVRRADSAALALLLDWRAAARKAGSVLRLVGVPEPLRGLARVNGVEFLLTDNVTESPIRNQNG